ncbi:hypothetical protein Cgig2_020033 [Carnegiea gigantea]|uniref:Ubiquitin-like protease family profile domain-containing protein n=1 Tax=Carnegiea gigantea TaxID=171969 RepID=A0A9Q1QBP9_9CARY|nr:hypothetical protein Cgig2_020033 [Carnegiea gigantea]
MRGKGRQARASSKGANDGGADNETVIDVAPLTMTVEVTSDGLRQMQCDLAEKMELPELQPHHICADYLEGLIHDVLNYDAGDDARKLVLCDTEVCDNVWKAKIAKVNVISSAIWERMKKRVDRRLHFVSPCVIHIPSSLEGHVRLIVCDMESVFGCSGHDCGLFVMAFMEVLSIRTDGLYFKRAYVRHMRDKCLLSIMLGKIVHYPEALEGSCCTI